MLKREWRFDQNWVINYQRLENSMTIDSGTGERFL
jgi:hypothetical protein